MAAFSRSGLSRVCAYSPTHTNNLLASQTLTFSLFGPCKQHPALATAVMRRLVPDLVGEVTDVRFEHSPGRGHPAFTADNTAFDVLIRCTTPRGRRAFVAIEVKYTEAPGGIASPERPLYDTLSQATRSFRDPNAPALRCAPIEQLWREQLLVTAMLERGLYEEGRLLVIAPTLNTECQAAIARYRTELISDDPAETRFQATSLEDVTAALGDAGADVIAERVTMRAMQTKITNAKYVHISDAGHLPYLDRPAAFNAEINGFLATPQV